MFSNFRPNVAYEANNIFPREKLILRWYKFIKPRPVRIRNITDQSHSFKLSIFPRINLFQRNFTLVPKSFSTLFISNLTLPSLYTLSRCSLRYHSFNRGQRKIFQATWRIPSTIPTQSNAPLFFFCFFFSFFSYSRKEEFIKLVLEWNNGTEIDQHLLVLYML